MTIAVTTPTGHVGSQVTRLLCQAGVRPRLLLRNPDRLEPELRDQAELAVGDQRDAGYVAEATRGAGGLAAAMRRSASTRPGDDTGRALLHLGCGYFMTNLLMDLDGLRAGRLSTTRDLDRAGPPDLARGRGEAVGCHRRLDQSAADL